MFFCFSSRRRHTRFDCDWSSDVCSSDLLVVGLQDQQPAGLVEDQRTGRGGDPRDLPRRPGTGGWKDRKSVVEGKRGDLGGRRIIKKKKKRTRDTLGGLSSRLLFPSVTTT